MNDMQEYSVPFDRLHSELIEWVEMLNPMSLQERQETIDFLLKSEGKLPMTWPDSKTVMPSKELPKNPDGTPWLMTAALPPGNTATEADMALYSHLAEIRKQKEIENV
jgi:hypothetical protein